MSNKDQTDGRAASPYLTAPTMPSAQFASDAWRNTFKAAIDAMFTTAERAMTPSAPLAFDPTAPARVFADLTMALMSDPKSVQRMQIQAVRDWQGYFAAQAKRMLNQPADPVISEDRGDRRFSDPAWKKDAFFKGLKEAYLLAADNMISVAKNTEGLDDQTRTRLDFFIRQFLYAIAPTNFATTNPAVIRKTLETGGLNLLSGLTNFLSDYSSSDPWVQRRASAEFEVGKDIAATPGAVVYQNDVMQLIQYEPTTKKAHKRPLLYVPPLVNKYYLMDLKPKSSLFRWLVEQGHTVFTISWKNPDEQHQDQDLTDYVLQGPVEAIEAIKQATGETKVDLFSFCMGGAIAASAVAYLTEKRKGGRIASFTMMATLMDYSQIGEWSTFADAQQIEAFNDHIHAKGFIAADDLKKLFSVVRANDLIWSSFVDHYLLDQVGPPSDLLHWFADGANMPKAFLSTWSKDVLRDNKLAQKEGVIVDGIALDFSKVKTPLFNLALKEDHVSFWPSVYDNAEHFGGPVTFVLGNSGHNAGIINPPTPGRHGYQINGDTQGGADDWLESAEKHDGSWWPVWQTWLTSGTLKQPQVDARYVGTGDLEPLEPAPGTYVLG